MSDIFQETILHHYEHPSNKGMIENPDVKISDTNTLCGDKVTMYARLNGRVLEEVKFDGAGCAISMASASLLTEKAKGMSIRDVIELGQRDVLEMLGLESLTPMRIKCAMLGVRTLQKGLIEYESKRPV
jgi:nitrogen fixation NifU-like protein